MSFLTATSSFIEKSLQCFADFKRLGAEAAPLGGVVNRAERELMFYGPRAEREMFAKECGSKIRVLSICLPFHNV